MIRKRSADCYSGHVIIEEQNSPIISTSHKSQQKTVSSQLMSTFKENRRQKQKPNSDYRQTGDEEEKSVNKKIMVSSTGSSSTGSSSTPQFGRFCGQMSVRIEKNEELVVKTLNTFYSILFNTSIDLSFNLSYILGPERHLFQ